MENIRLFRSCFVIDVKIVASGSAKFVTLLDSTNRIWHVDMQNEECAAGFKAWLKDTFLAGVAQTLTVFEYEIRGVSPDNENWIVKFFSRRPAQING